MEGARIICSAQRNAVNGTTNGRTPSRTRLRQADCRRNFILRKTDSPRILGLGAQAVPDPGEIAKDEASVTKGDTSEQSTLGALDAILGIAGETDAGIGVEEEEEEVSWIEAPIKRAMAGPMLPGNSSYLLLGLRFPFAATARQRKEGQRGVSLDFVVDTGSTVNVLMPAVAAELALPLDAEITPAGWGSQGAIAAAPQFVLGDCQLDHLAEQDRFTLMTGLKASGLMVPSPGAAGILGRAFLDCFPAVEFRLQEDVIRFHAEWDEQDADGMFPVGVELLGETGLWGVRLQIGGCNAVPALLDTGSPVTVLNSTCAAMAGLEVPVASVGALSDSPEAQEEPQQSLFQRLMGAGKRKQAPPPPPPMVPSGESLTISLHTITDEALAEIGSVQPMIGDLPGFAALGLSDGEPGAVLGLDALQGCARIVLVPRKQQIYIST